MRGMGEGRGEHLPTGAADCRRIAEDLKASEQRFRDLAEGSIQGILVHRDFKPLFANRACAERLGYDTPEDVLKLGSLTKVLPSHEHRRIRSFANARLRGETVSSRYELQALRKDGSLIWLELCPSVVSWDGRPAIQVTMIDIGGRKSAEENLRQAQANLEVMVAQRTRDLEAEIAARKRAETSQRDSEEKYRNLADNMEDGVFLIEDGVLAFVNRSLAGRLGYDVEEMVGRPIPDFLMPETRAITMDLHRRRVAGETVQSRYEANLLHKDGHSEVPVLLILARIVDSNGKVSVVGTARDVSERKRAEEALHESEEQFRALLDNSPQALNLKDAAGRYLLVNREWERQHAVSANAALGRTSHEVFGQETGESLAGPEREVIATGETQTFETTVLLPDGRRRTRLITKFPVRDQNSAVTRVGTVGTDITERKIMEEALRDTEEKFRALMDNSPLTVNLKHANGRFLMVNREFERQHGLRLSEAVGKTARQLFGEESAKAIEAADAKVIATGQTTTFEVDFQLEDGRRCTHLATKFPVRDGRGAITRLGSIGMDITDRKRMEREILESEERFREFAESSSDWLWEADSESRITFISGRVTDLLGVEPAAFVGRTWPNFAAPGQDAIWRDLEDTIQARRPLRDFRCQILDRHGRRRWLSISGKPRHSATGEFLGYRGTGTDITEKTQALHREAQVRERFLAAIETVPVSVALFDEDDRLVVANERFRVRLAVAARLRTSMTFEEILRAELKAGAIVDAQEDPEGWLRQRLERHRNPADNFEVHGSDGWFQVREHRSGDGYTLVVVHDITDRKKAEQGLLAARDDLEARVRERTHALEQQILERQYAEQALQQANQELEKRVEDRTRHLMEEMAERKKLEAQFIQAQKMEAIGQLAGGIAHDFNNLLTVIQGNLSWLKDKIRTDDDKASQLMAMALEAARRAGELTHRMLAFSRRQDLRPERVDLPCVLENITPLVARVLSESAHLEVKMGKDLWPLMVDSHQLESAILNVAINSRDAMPNGGSLILTAENRLVDAQQAARHDNVEPGEYVCLAMADTGIGMPPAVLDRVFDPFFTTKEVGKGSGLGLSMVFGFVKQSEGFVEITSQLGRGTTVELYLPRSRQPSATAAMSPKAAKVCPRGLTVLVVEDDPLVRGVALEYLKMAGFKPIPADDGNSAIKVMENTSPIDLILSDIIMPGGMSGLDLAEIVRQRWPETAVVLMSGYSYDEFSRRGINPDAVSLLRKPFTKHELLQKIEDAVSECAAGGQKTPTIESEPA
ncbi:MAG: PAS domain S-box protein [Rhodospirillales bacterium]|nr:PAS domain S-box protein [Rhodospirillales bacterium]